MEKVYREAYASADSGTLSILQVGLVSTEYHEDARRWRIALSTNTLRPSRALRTTGDGGGKSRWRNTTYTSVPWLTMATAPCVTIFGRRHGRGHYMSWSLLPAIHFAVATSAWGYAR